MVERSLCKRMVERSRLSASRYIFLFLYTMEKSIIYAYQYRHRYRVIIDDKGQSCYQGYFEPYTIPIEVGDDVKQERRVDVRTRKSTRV